MGGVSSRSSSNVLAFALAFAGCAIVPVWPVAAKAAPNFAPDNSTAWIALGQEFMAPDSGPGPVMFDAAHRPKAGQPAFRVADLSNPILQPWTREELRKANERALSGKAAYTPKERCWPIGVPGFLLYPVFPVYFLQAPKEVTLIWAEDHQVRHIYLDRKHSAHVTPSWFGYSIGRYEGDTLVVDTIGLNTRTFVDNFRTPHTGELHVVERFRMIDGGKTLEAKVRVEDPGAFTTPWNAIQRYRRISAGGDKADPRIPQGPLEEMVCAENNGDTFNEGLDPIPTAATPDF